MDKEEIAQEMLNYLNETGKFDDFLKWAEGRGFDSDSLENDILIQFD